MENKEIIELLRRYDTGHCSEEEKALVETWYLRQEPISTANLSELELESDLKDIFFSLPEVQKPKRLALWYKIGTAAVILITLGTFLYFNARKDHHTPQYVRLNNKEIKPGGNEAVLILANGQKVNLTNVAKGAIADQSGIKIRKTTNGQIIYDLSNTTTHASSSEYNTIETPLGGQYQVNLSDGTRVWLNSGSSLRYPIKFTGKERKVELTGEGYFEVAHNKEKPFKVSSLRQTVEVLGTHFDVMAYANEKIIKTTLLEGSVTVNHKNGTTLLKPGQQSLLTKDKVNVLDNIDLEDVISWKNGYFKFNESLESIMNKISRWYSVEIIYQTKPDPRLTYSGKISRARNISAILKIIEFNGDVHFKIEGKKIYVIK